MLEVTKIALRSYSMSAEVVVPCALIRNERGEYVPGGGVQTSGGDIGAQLIVFPVVWVKPAACCQRMHVSLCVLLSTLLLAHLIACMHV